MKEPSFDTWTIVFLISAAQGLLLTMVFGFSKYPPNRLLAAILLLFAITMTEYVLYWTGYIQSWVHWSRVSLTFPFLFGPILWLYFRHVFRQQRLGWRDCIHSIPFLIFLAAFTPYYLLSASEKISIANGESSAAFPSWLGPLCIWCSIAHLLGYTVWNFIYLRRQPHVGQTNKWAIWLNVCLFGYALAYMSYFILVRFDFFNRAWDYHISLMMTIFIYLIAIAGYIRPAIFQGYRIQESVADTKYRNSGLTDAAIHSLFDKLGRLMETEKLYRNADLNLDTLSKYLDASKHHVSQVINVCTEGTFFDYVNRLRIEEAKSLLSAHSRNEIHIIEVAYTVGFNNKVSFNTAFKKITGITPSAFRHQCTNALAEQPRKSG